jgi:hypothetical protein
MLCKRRLRFIASTCLYPVLFILPMTAASQAQDATSRLEKLIVEQQKQLDALRREVAGLKKREAAAPAKTTGARGAGTQVADAKPAEERFVLRGAVPLSWRIPGTDVDLKIGGKIKADVIGRVSGRPSLGAEDLFVVNAIDTRGTRIGDDAVRVHGRETRINIELTKQNTPLGPARAFVEGDFFGGGGNELLSNSDSFRLRHAFVEIGPVLAGQWWSTFTDPSAYAETLDFQGPGGEGFIRQGLVRYEHKFGNGLSIAGAIENPEGRVQLGSAAAVASSRDTYPDFVGRVRYQGGFGHIQAAGVVTQVNAPNGRAEDLTGYAGTITGRINLPFIAPKDNLRFQATYTNGATRFIQETGAILPSAFYNTGSTQAVAQKTFGGYVAFQHWWTNELRSNLVFGYVRSDLPRFAAASTFKQSQYGIANLIWSPWAEVDIGGEVQYGRRQDQDGAKGEQIRLQSSLVYRF